MKFHRLKSLVVIVSLKLHVFGNEILFKYQKIMLRYEK